MDNMKKVLPINLGGNMKKNNKEIENLAVFLINLINISYAVMDMNDAYWFLFF